MTVDIANSGQIDAIFNNLGGLGPDDFDNPEASKVGTNCTNGPGCRQLEPAEYLRVLQSSKFCLAPSGMGFSTRSYESVAQGW